MEPRPLDATNVMRVVLKELEMKACGMGREARAWQGILRPFFAKVERQVDVLDAEWVRLSRAVLGLKELRVKQDQVLANLRLALAQVVLAQGGKVMLSRVQRMQVDPETVIEADEQPDGSIEIRVTLPPPEPEKATTVVQ